MLNFGASKPRVKGGGGAGAPLDPHLNRVKQSEHSKAILRIKQRGKCLHDDG